MNVITQLWAALQRLTAGANALAEACEEMAVAIRERKTRSVVVSDLNGEPAGVEEIAPAKAGRRR